MSDPRLGGASASRRWVWGLVAAEGFFDEMGFTRGTMRHLAVIPVLVVAAASAGADVAEAVGAPPQAVAIVRQTPAGNERLVYLALPNPSGEIRAGLSLHYRLGATEASRALLDVPPGGAWDTLWLPEPAPERLDATLVRSDGTVLWSGPLSIPPRPARRIVIPQSPRVQLGELKPRMLRGTNYYPRHYPWPGIWREMTEARFAEEFAEMARLNLNTVRTFFMHDPERGLHRADGTFTPELLARIHTFLEVADRQGLKAMLCVYGGGGPPWSDLGFWRRYLRTGIEPFVYDGRVLMWDLINEPGGDKGPKATPELSRWIQRMWSELKHLDPEHLATIGLCWQFDQLWELGVKPEVGQYHNYSSATGVQPPGEPPVRNVADDLRRIAKDIDNRPLIIGEFGFTSAKDETKGWEGSEETQLRICRDVVAGAEAAVATGVNLVGLYNWCAFHFAPDWMGKGEQAFGVIRLDGSLKPAGELLRDTFQRWRDEVPAPWERRP
jgi:hypothetical protein